jgi:putative transposase
MPRQARIDFPGGLHHLMVRGIERKRIFRTDLDYEAFLDRLCSLLLETKTPCFAWVFMPNHVHLVLRTGCIPLASLMRRLLTGYAVTYNRRYHRHGPVFPNRYKSVLCQEDTYLLELVRYIHLNPLRAKIVPDMDGLGRYSYSGHSAIMDLRKRSWQDTDTVLEYFGTRRGPSQKKYLEYVMEGVAQGRRPDLVGGGLIRSLGGWAAVEELRKRSGRFKGDERILGNSDFVEEVLKASEEKMQKRYELRADGFDLEKILKRVEDLLNVSLEEIKGRGRYPKVVEARSLVSYWAVRELGMEGTEVARRLGVTQPAVSQAVARGARIVEERRLALRG